jgi:DNA-directed RNA polymerase specialized sigma24 family protein
MAGSSVSLLQHIRSLVSQSKADPHTDAALLNRFARYRDEAAFAALVDRHGPMVLHACRRALGDAHLAEDVFQAVFLVLAHKAGSLRRPDAVAAWLHGVARRLAWKAHADDARRRRREMPTLLPPFV